MWTRTKILCENLYVKKKTGKRCLFVYIRSTPGEIRRNTHKKRTTKTYHVLLAIANEIQYRWIDLFSESRKKIPNIPTYRIMRISENQDSKLKAVKCWKRKFYEKQNICILNLVNLIFLRSVSVKVKSSEKWVSSWIQMKFFNYLVSENVNACSFTVLPAFVVVF